MAPPLCLLSLEPSEELPWCLPEELPMVKAAVHETHIWSMGQEDPLEKEMANHSSILAWRNPWTEEPDGLQSMGSQRVKHN